MKKIIVSLCAVGLAVGSFAGEKYVFSSDAAKAQSGERQLPMQGVNLKTGKVVLGLPRLSDPEKAECGWYRVIPFEFPVGVTNKVFKKTGYTFSQDDGTATQVGETYDKPVVITVQKYSKLKIYEAAAKLNKWAALEAWMQETTIENVNLYQAWQMASYITDHNDLFTQAKTAAATAMGMTVAEVDELLKNCEDGTELINESGEVVTARGFLRR